MTDKVSKSDADWRAMLDPMEYQVTRHAATERAFTGEYCEAHEDGLYACVCCGTPLYDSRTKFESGTGWPSFTQPIAPDSVTDHSDTTRGMVRTETRCARCDSHLGHVFPDGPPPTGERHCLNSVSLGFTEDGQALPNPLQREGAEAQPA